MWSALVGVDGAHGSGNHSQIKQGVVCGRKHASLAALLAELLIFVFPSVQLTHCPWSLLTESDSHGLMSSQTVKRWDQEPVLLQPDSVHFLSSLHNSLFLYVSWGLMSVTKVIQQGLRVFTVSLLL